jgi:HK97 family phage prohead protease
MTTAAKRVAHEQIRVPFEVKAVDEAAHTFTGLAAAWSQDLGNDVIHPGAFARTLDHWKSTKRRRPVPLIDMHTYWSVSNVIGKMVDAQETADGLEATFDFVPNDEGAQGAFRRVQGGYITALSIGYSPVRWEFQQIEGGKEWEQIRHLHEVKLMEVSLVIWGMNEDALIDADSVKSVEALKSLLTARLPTMEEPAKAEFRALLAPPAPPLAPAASVTALKQRLLALTLRRLATRARGSAHVES